MKKLFGIITCLILILSLLPVHLFASGSITFEKKGRISEFSLDELYEAGNSIIYYEYSTSCNVVWYFDKRTMKLSGKYSLPKSSSTVFSEKSFIVYTLMPDSIHYDKYSIDVKSGSKKLLASNLSSKDIYNLKDTEKTNKDDVKYFLKSDKYGDIYSSGELLYWRHGGTTHQAGVLKPLKQTTSELPENAFCINQKGDKLCILNSPDSFILFDLKAGKSKIFAMNNSYNGVMFIPSDKNLILLYINQQEAQQHWMSNLTIFDNKKYIPVSEDALDISFFNNRMVFRSDVRNAGMMDQWAESVTLYDLNSYKSIGIKSDIANYKILDGKLFIYTTQRDNDISKRYLFNIKTNKIIPSVIQKKYIGNGLYMADNYGYSLEFTDKSNNVVCNYVYGAGPVCAILPGYRNGFVYNGKKLFKITLPDAKRYSASSSIKVTDSFLMYLYPDKEIVRVRILKYK